MSATKSNSFPQARGIAFLGTGLTAAFLAALPSQLSAQTVQRPNSPTAIPVAAGAEAAPALDGSDRTESMGLAQLEQREGELIDRLAVLRPTDPGYQVQLRKIGQELKEVQNRIQTLRQKDALGSFEQQGQTGETGAMGSLPTTARNVSNTPVSDNGAIGGAADSEAADEAEDEGGNGEQGKANLAESDPTLSPFYGMDAESLGQMRTELTSQLKYLQQTLKTLSPDDEALAQSLKDQQAELVSQLRALDKAAGNVQKTNDATVTGEAEGTGNADNLDSTDSVSGNLVQLNGVDTPTNAPGVTNQEETAPQAFPFPNTGTSETGQLYNNDRGIDPLFLQGAPTEAEGTWYGADNKSQQILDKIEELQKANEETQKRLNEVMEELKTIETQLKLLSRQAVAAADATAGAPGTPAPVQSGTSAMPAQKMAPGARTVPLGSSLVPSNR